MIKFVSDLWLLIGFFLVVQFSPPYMTESHYKNDKSFKVALNLYPMGYLTWGRDDTPGSNVEVIVNVIKVDKI